MCRERDIAPPAVMGSAERGLAVILAALLKLVTAQ